MARRTRGEGSIYRQDDGLWAAAIVVDGRRIVKRAKKQEDVRNWLVETRGKANQGMIAPEGRKQTVGEYLGAWLQTHGAAIRPKTFCQYEGLIRLHIVPVVGKSRISDLRPSHLQNLYSRKLAEGLSARSVQLVHTVLHRALKQALLWGLVVRNVADAVEPPRPGRKEMVIWSPAELRRFLDAATGDRTEALFVLACTTGLRRGEILALRWADVDLMAGRMQVRRTLTRLPKQGLVEGEPKSAAGRRQVLLPPLAIHALREHRRRQFQERLLAGEKWRDLDLVFPSTIGTPTEETTLRRVFQRLTEKAGLPHLKFHGLRHSFATLQLSAGTHPKKVQAALGHSSVALTLDTYSHVTEAMQEEVRDVTERALGS